MKLRIVNGVLLNEDGTSHVFENKLIDAAAIISVNVISGFQSYKSPVTGEVISSSAARKDDLKKHGCVEYDPSIFAKKHKKYKEDQAVKGIKSKYDKKSEKN